MKNQSRHIGNKSSRYLKDLYILISVMLFICSSLYAETGYSQSCPEGEVFYPNAKNPKVGHCKKPLVCAPDEQYGIDEKTGLEYCKKEIKIDFNSVSNERGSSVSSGGNTSSSY